MLRDKNLIPLSHQHQHALALCVRIDRAIQAGAVEMAAWQAEIHQFYTQETQFHFLAEEKDLFPVALRFDELRPLVAELLAEHATLREFFAKAGVGTLDNSDLENFARALSTHIRKEERQLFEGLQQRLSPEQLLEVGSALNLALNSASNSCILQTEATRLRPRS